MRININNETESQLCCENNFINDANTKYNLNDIIFYSGKNNNGWSSSDNDRYMNLTLLNIFFDMDLRNHYFNDLSESVSLMQETFEALKTKTFKSFLLNKYPDDLNSIPNEKEQLSSYIYKKRFYSNAHMLLGISNISLLQFYYLNKEEIDETYQKQIEYKNTISSRYYDTDTITDSPFATIFDKYNNYKKSDLQHITELDSYVEAGIDDIIEIISIPNYLVDEFDSSLLSIFCSLLLDYLVTTNNKKLINKLFLAFHNVSNNKNIMFFQTVYNKKIHSKKPFVLMTNHPKLTYFYLLFYKNMFKGKYFRKILKHNALGLLLLGLKNVNNTSLNVSKFMPKFETMFNKYKGSGVYTLNTFLQIDAILTSNNIALTLDILEQNNEIMKLLFEDIYKHKNNTSRGGYYYGYYRNRVFKYNFNKINFLEHLAEKKSVGDVTSTRFWDIVSNFLLNTNLSYSAKKKIIEKLKTLEIYGYDQFAVSAPMELQQIICELYLS